MAFLKGLQDSLVRAARIGGRQGESRSRTASGTMEPGALRVLPYRVRLVLWAVMWPLLLAVWALPLWFLANVMPEPDGDLTRGLALLIVLLTVHQSTGLARRADRALQVPLRHGLLALLALGGLVVLVSPILARL